MAESAVERAVYESAQRLLTSYFSKNGLEGKFPMHSTSEASADPTLIINNFEEAGNPLVFSVSTTLIDKGIGSYFVPSAQLHSDTQVVASIALRAGCIQGACPIPSFFSLLDKVCSAEDTKQICSNVTDSTDHEKLNGLFFKVANLGTHNQAASKFTLILSNNQKMVKLFKVKFGKTIIEDTDKRVVNLDAGESGTPLVSEIGITGRCDLLRLGT